MTKQMPAFVYGTLREGFGNYSRLLEGKVKSNTPATLEGFEMFSVGGFPAILPADGVIVGELIEIDEDQYTNTLHDLDILEGYYPGKESHSMYLRKTMTVTTEDGEKVEAYVYIWNRPAPRIKVTSGDWKQYVKGLAAY